jgi:hypothetical protein
MYDLGLLTRDPWYERSVLIVDYKVHPPIG